MHASDSLTETTSNTYGGWCCRPSGSPRVCCSCCTHEDTDLNGKDAKVEAVSVGLGFTLFYGTHTLAHTAYDIYFPLSLR
ncbi:hypothetical protein F7725_028889 [Dissostichus mawsoni]|uniref:Uncharacterized protein n=1 Tax=Dissostichus mawsoni TaxID=36200 RepID=A0A7J5XHD9_DISMA|nr:hypothetical protein F7725_028889 [Dissostichus mawsoni]